MKDKLLTMIVLMIFLPILLPANRVFSQNSGTKSSKVWVIPIHGEINRLQVVFLKRSVMRAKREGADIVIFDVDTFGGRVDSALQITTLIGSLKPTKTIAFVTAGPESKGVSWSAGALISFSCNNIYMAPGTSIGAAAPIVMGSQGTEPASEKVVSAIRGQIAALAEKNGYPPKVAQAMVDADIELQEVRINGRVKLMTPDEIKPLKEKYKKAGKTLEVGGIVSARGKLLTLTAQQMRQYGISSGITDNVTQLLSMEGVRNAAVTRIKKTPADRAVGVITSPLFVGLLVVIGLVALYIEITTPGFGLPGTIALVCFAVIFSSYALLGTVGSLELLLFIAGIVLLILEIFVIPGFGIAGISGIILISLSIILSMQGFILPTFQWQKEVFKRNLLTVGIGVVSSFVIFAILAYTLPKMKFFSPLMLRVEQDKEMGYTVQTKAEEEQWLGKKGIATTTLRPSGKAQFGDNVIYVQSDGEFIEKGNTVEVVEVTGNRIVVRKC